jgi:hypothetical protein
MVKKPLSAGGCLAATRGWVMPYYEVPNLTTLPSHQGWTAAHPMILTWSSASVPLKKRYNGKGEVLYHPPGPNPPARTKDAGTTPCDLHERHLPANRSEEVQYATRRFIRGA